MTYFCMNYDKDFSFIVELSFLETIYQFFWIACILYVGHFTDLPLFSAT